ncbi:MAG: Cys-Gln thioester bond-forming surface protein [Clostridia bacterium]|nr:Cys-Gln thioester bond-forming surface protein [Clostridia bacterium]
MVKQKKKIIYAILLIVYLLNSFAGIVSAAQISNADIVDLGDCGYHLQFWDTKQNAWSYIITTMAGYYYNGELHYAYCMQADRKGVGENGNYTVNISDLLDNVQVWRTITAGFPYRTAGQLGCSTDQDAFVATKQAIYCIIYGFNPETRYKGGDARGTAIKNAIINLVNEGKNGTRTPANANVSVKKINDLIFDDNYCYQEFSVSSLVNIGSYTVTATNGLPSGSKIVNTNNNEQSTFNGNEHFKVQIPKNTITGNLEGTVAVRAKCETYPIFYGNAPSSSLQDYALTFDPLSDESGIAKFNVNAYKSSIKVIKQDSLTKYKISGVEFNFKYADGENIGNFTTDKNGEITISNLKPGKVIAKEIKTDKDYILDTKEKEINLSYAENVVKSIDNDKKTGNLKIYKVDMDNNKIGIGDVEFDLYSKELNKVVGTYHTNVNGEIYIKGLRVADYSVIEKSTNKWYNLADPIDIKIEGDTDKVVTIGNKLKSGQIKVIKVDKDNKEHKLEGVKFGVYDKNNNLLETIVTDKNGEAITKEYALRDFDSLKLVELETQKDYVLNDKPETVKLEENQIKTVIFENKVKTGKIKVIKVDQDNKEVKIEGVKFIVKDDKGNVVDTIITDKNGEAVTKELPITSNYTIYESETQKAYKLTDKIEKVTLTQDEIKTLTFENEKRKGQLRVIKVDKDNNEVLLEGVTFDVLDSKGKVVDTIKTNEKGEAITKELPCIDEKYTVIERETKKEYVLTEKPQTVELKEDEITSIKFENEKIKGYVEITKVDSKTKEKLEGAKFGIFNENDKQISTIITNKSGIAKSGLLPYGKYYLKELDSGSVYYLLNEKTYKFEIVKNHDTVPVTIENDGVEIEVDVDKKGTIEIKPGEMVNYEFSNVANTSNVYLENFKWYDYIPTDYVRLQTMSTGTWNQDLTYSVYYKTNKSEDYILRYENLKTTENHTLDFTTEIELAEDEYITETMFDFGKVDIGFKEDIKPTMECKSLDTLKNNQTFTNKTRTVGTYFGITAESSSKWTTIVHVPEEHKDAVLPRTGK